MRRRCPACGRDPGNGSTCDECGAPVYRYAVEADEWAAANPDYEDAWDIDPADLDIDDVDIPPPPPDLVPPPVAAPPAARPPAPRPSERTRPSGPAPAPEAPGPRRSGCRGCLVVLLVIVLVGGALAFFASLVVTDGSFEFESGSATSPAAGECLDLEVVGADTVDTVEVPCNQPHDAEAFHRIVLADGPFPGAGAVADEADARCLERFPEYVGTEYAASEYWLDSLVPNEAGWSVGDREIVCLLVSGDGSPMTGSGYQSGR